MSDDVQYRVRTIYETDTSKGVSGVGALSAGLGGLSSLIDTAISGLRTVATVAAAVGGATALAGIAAMAHGVANLNAHAEETTLTIAGMVRAAGVENAAGTGLATWGESMQFAQQAMRQIREDAARLPGTEEDFITIFRTALPGALNAGMRAADVSNFTNRFGAVGRAFQIDAPQIGRDLSMMLEGRAGQQVRSWVAIRSHVGKTAEEFNQLTAPERLRLLQGAIGHFDELINEYQNTWEAQWSTAQSHVTRIHTIMSRPMFDAAKEAVRDMNALYDRNAVLIREVAYGVGTLMAQSFRDARRDAEGMVETMGQLLRSSHSVGELIRNAATRRGGLAAAAMGAFDTASGLVGRTSAAIASNPAQAASMAGAAITAATFGPMIVSAAVAALSSIPGLGLLVGAVGAFAGHATEAGQVMDSLRGIGGSLWSIFGNLWSVLVQVESFLGNVLASLLPGLAAGIGHVISGLSDFIAGIRPALGNLLNALTPLFTTLGGVIGELARELGTELGPMLRALGEVTGHAVSALAGLIRWVNNRLGEGQQEGSTGILAGVDSYVGAALMTGVDAIGRGVVMRGMNALAGLPMGSYDIGRVWDDALASQRRWHGITPAGETPAGPGAAATPRGGSGPMYGPPTPTLNDRLTDAIQGLRRTFEEGQGRPDLGGIAAIRRAVGNGQRPVVNVTINNTINAADDPDRVLVLTRRAIQQGIFAPIESPTVRVTR